MFSRQNVRCKWRGTQREISARKLAVSQCHCASQGAAWEWERVSELSSDNAVSLNGCSAFGFGFTENLKSKCDEPKDGRNQRKENIHRTPNSCASLELSLNLEPDHNYSFRIALLGRIQNSSSGSLSSSFHRKREQPSVLGLPLSSAFSSP